MADFLSDRLARFNDPSRPEACEDCGRRPVPSHFVDDAWVDNHSGTCPRNGALQVCERCGHRHVDVDFGQALACIMDVPLDEGREMQRRIVNRFTNGLGIAPPEPDDNGSQDGAR